MRLRGRNNPYKLKGYLADKIISDYKAGIRVIDILQVYKISRTGLYGLLKRVGYKK
jgi:hypothetical protein